MALNPNIILGGRTAKFDAPDPVEQYTKGLQLKGLMSQQALADQTLADDRSNRDAFAASGGDSAKYLQALAAGGNYKAYATALKQKQDQEKSVVDMDHTRAQTAQSQATAGKTAQETRFAAADQHARSVVNVQTPQDVVAYVDSGIANGVFPKEAREQMLQKAAQAPSIEAWKQQQTQLAIPVLERFKQDAENSRNTANNQTRITTTQMTNDVTRRGQDVSASTARRGQDLVDGRSREATAATLTKPFEVTGPDGNPVLVQQDKAGNIKPVQGYSPKTASDKPLNDSQSKALLFGSRMREADNVLETLAKEGTTSSVPGSRTPGVGGVISALSTGNQQALDQAKRDFMTAVLRRESGASIAPTEFATADKQYFPQIGDSEKVLKQKAANRKLAIDGVLIEVPEKHRASLQPRGGATGSFDSATTKTKAGASVSNW